MLDTNILGYLIKGISPALTQRVRSAAQMKTICTSVICRAELQCGQDLMAVNDKRHAQIDMLLLELPAMPWSVAAADQYGEIKALLKRQGIPIAEMRTKIAAHASPENLILVIQNTRHLERVTGLKIEGWMA